MHLPFTEIEFLNLFAQFNAASWPVQILADGAILAVALCTLYTVRVILPHARPRDPRGPRKRREHPQPVHR